MSTGKWRKKKYEEVTYTPEGARWELEDKVGLFPKHVVVALGEENRVGTRLVTMLCGLLSGRGWWTQDFLRGGHWS